MDSLWSLQQNNDDKDGAAAERLTAVGVDVVGLQEADSQVVQDGRFMQVTESGEVVLPDQDVGVTQEGERVTLRTHGVLQRLRASRYTINTQSQIMSSV